MRHSLKRTVYDGDVVCFKQVLPARKETQAYQVYLAQRGIVDLLAWLELRVRLASDVTAICGLIQTSFYCLVSK